MLTKWLVPSLVAVSLSALLIGCHELPLVPELEEAPSALTVAQSHTVPSFVCTHHWVGGSSQRWYDRQNWSPASVPDSLDSACIDAPGAYPVVSDYYVRVRNLRIGGPGAVPYVTHVAGLFSGWFFEVERELVIEPSGSLHLEEAGDYSLGDSTEVTNYGILKTGTMAGPVPEGMPTIIFHRLLNFGVIDFLNYTDFTITEGGSFENHGDVRGVRRGQVEFEGHGTFVQAAGSIGGDGLYVDGRGAPASIPEFRWTGGTLGEHPLLPGTAAVKVWDSDVRLNTTTLSGLLSVWIDRADTVSIYGSVGQDVQLAILGWETSVARFRRQVAGGFYQNRGTITASPWIVGFDLALVFEEGLENLGSLRIDGVQRTRLEADSLLNRGSIDVAPGKELYLTGAQGAGFARNTGTIAAQRSANAAFADGKLLVGPGVTFESGASGTMTGDLELRGATLRGLGSVGKVLSFGGAVKPGAPFGTLTLDDLRLDAQSLVELEVADSVATGHDQLDVRNGVTLDGQLSIVTVPPFRGGRCGQVVRLLTHDPAVPLSGRFANVQGLAQANPNAWRVDTQPGLLQIVGYTTGSAAASLSQATVQVTEGKAGKSYFACLGRRAPVADVQLTANGGAGQLTLAPPALFDLTTWRLPRLLTVAAIDDAVSENTQVYPVAHTFISADPTFNNAPVLPLSATVIDDDTAADLSVVLVSQQDNRFVGDTMDTVLRVTNGGPFTATGVVVTSTPLVGLTFVSATGAACSVNGANMLTCTLGTQLPAAQVAFTVRFRGAVAGLHSNTLTVSGGEPDPVSGNNAVVYTQRVN